MARPTLFTHPKLAVLEMRLGSRPLAVGVLELLWNVAYQDGNARLGRPEVVEHIAGWRGEPGACAAALVEAGFLDELADGSLAVHDLADHAPEYVLTRYRMEARRRGESVSRQDVRERLRSEARNGSGCVPERIRNCSATPAPAPAPIEHVGASSDRRTEVVLELPTRGDNAWPLSAAKLAEYQKTHPRVDVLSEARKARQWLIDNPRRRKTSGGMPKFLGNWMAKAARSAPPSAVIPPQHIED